MGAVRTSEPRKVTLMQNDRCFDTNHPTVYLIVIHRLSNAAAISNQRPPPTHPPNVDGLC